MTALSGAPWRDHPVNLIVSPGCRTLARVGYAKNAGSIVPVRGIMNGHPER
jgi:hypothetical protein